MPITTASRVGTSSGSVLADSKTKYWVSDNSSYNVSYGNANTNTYDDADLDRADNDTDYIYRWIGVAEASKEYHAAISARYRRRLERHPQRLFIDRNHITQPPPSTV